MPSPTPRQRPAVQPQTNPRRSVCGKDAASARFTGLLPSAPPPRPSAPNRARNAAADQSPTKASAAKTRPLPDSPASCRLHLRPDHPHQIGPAMPPQTPLESAAKAPWTQLLRGLSPSSATPSNPSTPLKSPTVSEGKHPGPVHRPPTTPSPHPESRSPGMTAAEQTPLPDLPSIPEKASAPQKRPTSQYKFKPQSPTRPRTQPRPTPPETPPLHRTPQRR